MIDDARAYEILTEIYESILTWDKDNGMILCKVCHGKSHKGDCSAYNMGNINVRSN